MRTYFGGAEAPTLRRRLRTAGATRFAVSFWHLRDRLPKSGDFPFAERFPTGAEILLDSGGYTANRRRGEHDDDFWVDYLDQYVDLVADNLADLALVTEFDFLEYDIEDIWALRFETWNAIPREKFLPVWHPEHGFDELERAAEIYPQVAIPGSALEKVAHRLPSLANRHGCLFHGLAVSSQEIIEKGGLASVSSTAWTAATRYGERMIFDGNRLHRYGKDSKDEAIMRHRPVLERAELDIDLLLEEDPEELTRLAVWSLDAWGAHLSRRMGVLGTPRPAPEAQNVESEEPELGTPPSRGRHEVVPRTPGSRKFLPVLGVSEGTHKTTDEHGNVVEVRSESQLTSRNDSVRECNTCYVKNACPEFKPDSGCAYDIPVQIRTREQLTALLSSVLEMQAQRAMFSRFAEELEGGYPTSTTSKEFDRLFSMTSVFKEIQDNREFLRVSVETRGQAGVLSRLFGDQAGERMRELENPMTREQTDEFLADVVEAEVMD